MEEKLISGYTGLSFREIEELYIDDYWLLLRDAYIHQCRQTEEGRDYLEKCWYLEQEEPDRDGLRAAFRGDAGNADIV